MMPNLSLSTLNNKPLQMTKRNQFIYKLIGQIQSKKSRINPKYTQHFYQLNVNCQNFPTVKKIFAFQPKLNNPLIWNALETNAYLGKKYLFACRNYSGSYYLVDMEEWNE